MAKMKIKINVGKYESIDVETGEYEDIIYCLAELVESLDLMLKFHVKTQDRAEKRKALIWHRDLYFEIVSHHDEKLDRQALAKDLIMQRRREENAELDEIDHPSIPIKKKDG